jgi:methionine synthase I (cobalamin-dependent)/5,10-methylenetetrahydrofolate reductase
MRQISLRERLTDAHPILADGGMGTLLHQRGTAIHDCFDSLNLSMPELVIGIHQEYITAGARLIETNTFGANRMKLEEYGLADRVAEINQKAVAHVQEAIRRTDSAEPVYIAGAVGPLGGNTRSYGRLTLAEITSIFEEQIRALIGAGVDAIILETFTDHSEINSAIEVTKALQTEMGRDVVIIAQMTFAQDNRTPLGHNPARVAHDLSLAGVDVIGVNCGTGPSQISNVLQQMHTAVPTARFSAMPNAGFPEAIGGRVMYSAKADYFGQYAVTFRSIGANIIGGCCGTTPAHIRAMRDALNKQESAPSVIHVHEDEPIPSKSERIRPTELARRLADGRFTVTVEMAPPRSFEVEALVNHAHLLRAAGADIVDVADTPAARMRMSAYAAAHVIQSQVGLETVLHFPTRGRNILRVQGDLLAAHALDLRNLFVTMGDPTKIGDYPDANDGYDIVPSKLIDLIAHQMNNGQDMGGNSIGRPTSFTVGCALNMFADNLGRELGVLEKKLEAGADFALGQAVFEPHKIEIFLQAYEERFGTAFRLPVLMGIMPLYSVRQAQFLHNEVPGISIPDTIMKRLEDAGENAPSEGVLIAQETLRAIQGLVAGAYIIPAFNKYELAAEVIDAVTIAR